MKPFLRWSVALLLSVPMVVFAQAWPSKITDRFVKQGVEPKTGTPEQFGDLIKSEVARWADVIKTVGIRAD